MMPLTPSQYDALRVCRRLRTTPDATFLAAPEELSRATVAELVRHGWAVRVPINDEWTRVVPTPRGERAADIHAALLAGGGVP